MSVKIFGLLLQAPNVLRPLEGISSLMVHDSKYCCKPSQAKMSILEAILLENWFFQKNAQKNARMRLWMFETHLQLLKSQFLCFQTYYWRQKRHLSWYRENSKIPFFGLKIPCGICDQVLSTGDESHFSKLKSEFLDNLWTFWCWKSLDMIPNNVHGQYHSHPMRISPDKATEMKKISPPHCSTFRNRHL